MKLPNTKKSFKLFLCAANDIVASLRTLASWSTRHRGLSAAIVGVVFLLSVSQINRRGEYYFRTGDEVAYLQTLRVKYGGKLSTMSVPAVQKAIWQGCKFLADTQGGNRAYDSVPARDLLFGTAVMESDLRPRFQDSNGDAIGLFQIEYGTYRDILTRVLKRDNRKLYDALVARFGGANKKIAFEDMQTKPELAAIFARLKYAQSPDPIPSAGDFEAQGLYYKRFYNTKFGLGQAGVFVKKRLKFAVNFQ